MKQNWKQFTLLITLKISLFISCTQRQDLNEFTYKNESNHDVEIVIYDMNNVSRNITILEDQKLSFIDFTITNGGDSLAHIIFDQEKMLTHINSTESASCQTRNSLYCFDSFKEKRIDRHTSEYIYTFAEEDYQNAEPILLDYNLLENLIGTEWRCNEGEDLQDGVEFTLFRFISATRIQGWVKEEGFALELFFEANFALINNVLTVTDQEGDFFTGLLEGNQITTNIDGDGECVFIKQ